MTPRIPRWSWDALRAVTFAAALLLCIALFAWPRVGLFAWWGIAIPLLPLVFFVAPGLWRNLCPLATSNQLPRRLGFQRARGLPMFARNHGFLVPIVLFLGLVPARKVLFNADGTALSVLLLAMGAVAFIGGIAFKGKSGWCSSFCPLLPVQRVYGQTPFVVVRNSHCEPCVACTQNCYDFNPNVAQLADLDDSDPHRAAYRKLFAGAFPALVLAFYTTNSASGWRIVEMYGRFGAFVLVGIGAFYTLESTLPVSSATVASFFGGAALDLYYWFNWPLLAQRIGHASPWWFVWPARGIVFGLSFIWVARTLRKERRFAEETSAQPAVRLGVTAGKLLDAAAAAARPDVTILPDERRVAAVPGTTLLELIEKHGVSIEAGCRMGICGSDPICVVAGADNLSPMGEAERTTLDRLGLADTTRMACCARVAGPVTISLEPEPRPALVVVGKTAGDVSIRRVVVIGNGIAGITSADHVRRRHSTCEIDVISRERHHLYNRMAITRLIYGRSAMQNLYLLKDQWYDENRITTWLNTQVVAIDREQDRVVLGTGDSLQYDRLILTAGSRNFIPQIDGFGRVGTFALREAEDAMRIRAFIQEHGARHAVVAGAGPLGLEAAHALKKFGLHVTVLQIGERLLPRQLDARGSQFLLKYLEGLGLEVIVLAQTASVRGNGTVTGVTLEDGREIDADLFLVCAGITPNVEIAKGAGLEVNRGVIVDERMQTSDPKIFAAGDAAEFGGHVSGQWPTAVKQGEVAALNALGAEERYEPMPAMTILKVTGVDLTSIGRFEPETDDDSIIVREDMADRSYRKLVIRDGKIVGAILLGYSLEAPGIDAAVRLETDVRPWLDRLRVGDWSMFVEQERSRLHA